MGVAVDHSLTAILRFGCRGAAGFKAGLKELGAYGSIDVVVDPVGGSLAVNETALQLVAVPHPFDWGETTHADEVWIRILRKQAEKQYWQPNKRMR